MVVNLTYEMVFKRAEWKKMINAADFRDNGSVASLL